MRFVCPNCHRTFREDEVEIRDKNLFALLWLTIKAQWDRTISEDDCRYAVCPECRKGRLLHMGGPRLLPFEKNSELQDIIDTLDRREKTINDDSISSDSKK